MKKYFSPYYLGHLHQQIETLNFKQTFHFVKNLEYYSKLTITGDLLRLHTYEFPVFKLAKLRSSYKKDKDKEKTSKSLYRTRQNLVDLINSNKTKYTKFLTLTYTLTQLDRKNALKHLKLFLLRYKRLYGHNLKYVGLLERQKERGKKENNIGSLHFHLVCFIDHFIPLETLNSLWTFGFTDIKKIKNGDIGRYIAKYLTKDKIDDITKTNEKIIFRSRNLKKPKILYDEKIDDYLKQTNGEVKFSSSYNSKLNGRVIMLEIKR